MLIIGCDYHPGFQQIACVDTDGGELSERRLAHREQAEQFYRELKQQDLCVRVGMESSGHSRWFERLLHELGFELWIGDPADPARAQAENRSTRCPAITAVNVGESLSADLGAGRRES
jgi:transposase